MATKKAVRAPYTRTVSTRQQKIDAINYVRSACEKKWKITDGGIVQKFGVSNLVKTLAANGVLIKIKGNGRGGVYQFHAGGVTPADMVEMFWQLHGKDKENGVHKEPVQPSLKFPTRVASTPIAPVEKKDEPVEIGDMVSTPKTIEVKINPIEQLELPANIDEWLRMCDQFKIGERGEFIFMQLKMLGYVK
jgi:hypothetical protein